MTQKPIPVAYGIARLGIGGAERQLYELARRIAQHGYRPLVFALEASGLYAELLRAEGIPVFDLGLGARLDPRPILRLKRILHQHNVRILHTYGFYAGLYGRLAALWAGTPIRIHSERATRAWLRALNNPLYFAIDRRLSRHTDLIIANAQAVRQFVVDTKRLPAAQVQVIYNGVDDAWFLPVPDAAIEEVRQHYGWPYTERLVGMIARIDPMKDHRTLLKAAQIVLANRPTTRFVIAGDGMLRADLEAFAQQLAIRDQITFTGAVRGANLKHLFAALDVFVLTSREGEGCSNAILEAMALGRPIVATRVGGNSELLVDGTSGFLVDPEMPAELAARIERLLDSPALAQVVGAQARDRATRYFSAERMVQQTVRAYAQLGAPRYTNTGAGHEL